MSCFVCPDSDFSFVANFLFEDQKERQYFADSLKKENIKSVNFRYKEKTKCKKVNLNHDQDNEKNPSIVLHVLERIEYQSDNHPDFNSFPFSAAKKILTAQGAESQFS